MEVPVAKDITVREMIDRLVEVAKPQAGDMREAMTPWLDVRLSVAAQDDEFWGTIFRHSSRGLSDLLFPLVADQKARDAAVTAIVINSGR